MKKFLLFAIIVLPALTAFTQKTLPRIDVYGQPGFFLEGLNHDGLVPKKVRGQKRLGDEGAGGIAVTLNLPGSRWVVKGGLGYREKHYSLSKYNIGDFIGALFLFDSPYRTDSFALSSVKFTNRYIEVPLSIAYSFTRRQYGIFTFTAGINIRPGFLISSSANIKPDASAQPIPSNETISTFKNTYTHDASKVLLTIEPYFESTVFVYRGIGVLAQLRPFSFYSSKLNKKFTTDSFELFGFGLGLVYDFSR